MSIPLSGAKAPHLPAKTVISPSTERQQTPAIQSQFKIPAKDTIRFSGDTHKIEETEALDDLETRTPPKEYTRAERVKSALKEAGKSLIDGKFWLKQAAVAGAITLATCWLPGSQLVLIPAWLAMAGTIQASNAAISGYKHPDGIKNKPELTGQTNTQNRSIGDKLKGAAKGAWNKTKDDFVSRFKQNLLISAAITLATCWLPGSQLLTIPAWFCMDSAISAIQGAYNGWNGIEDKKEKTPVDNGDLQTDLPHGEDLN